MGTVIYNDVLTLARDLQAFKRYYTGCSALLAYDYLLTFSDEIEYAWGARSKKSFIFVLFLINRYVPIAFCGITLFAYYSPLWTFEICNRFAIVKWLQTLLIVIPAETVLLLRARALSNKYTPLVILLSSIMISQCIIVFYAMSRPEENNALRLPPLDIDAFHVCILYSNPVMDASYLSVSVLFDSLIFGLTFLTTSGGLRHLRPKTILMKTIQRDGFYYFLAILAGNIVWLTLSLSGRPGLKLMNAQPSLLFTSILINRLTLSLRRVGDRNHIGWGLETFGCTEHELSFLNAGADTDGNS